MAPTEPNEATEAEEEREALTGHAADRDPTDEEIAAADTKADAADANVSRAYEEAAEIGANVKGEGQIEP
ncbi:MAG TPA: hypothetical protein VHA73_15830 [Acidimicrobiales bacterium]|jgi:hypothetical protein|nr:hypothetical protein [Acidimicrobiales bacterium]